MNFKKYLIVVFFALSQILSGFTYGDTEVETKKDDGYILNWLICGPFPNYATDDNRKHDHATVPCWGYDNDFLAEYGGETGITPIEGMYCESNGIVRTWRKYLSRNTTIDFNMLCAPGVNSVAYAYCEINRTEAIEGLLSVGSDDGIKIWLNGDLVHNHHLRRGVVADDDMVAVNFAKGRNKLLVKVDNDIYGFGFCLRSIFSKDAQLTTLRENLMLVQDKFLITSRDDRIAVKIVGNDMNLRNYKPNIKICIIDPNGKTHAITDEYKLGDTLYLTDINAIEGFYQLNAVVTDPYGIRPILTGYAYLPDLASSASAWEAMAAYLQPKGDMELYKNVLANWTMRLNMLNSFWGHESDKYRVEAMGVVSHELADIARSYNGGRDFLHEKKEGVFVKTYRSKVDDSFQPYAISLPKIYDNAKKHPVILWLHGSSSVISKEEMFIRHSKATHLLKNDEEIVMISIYGRGNTFYQGLGEDDVLSVIDDVKRQYTIDETRIYLAGHSMGGYGVWFLAAYHPDIFAAIAPFAGGCDYRIDIPDWWNNIPIWGISDTMTYYGIIQFAENFMHVPNYIYHGEMDSAVSVEHSRRMAARLKELAYDVTYKELPGADHTSLMWLGSAPDVYSNLLSHRLNKFPKKIAYKTITLKYNGAYWIVIDRFQEYGAIAKIEADISDRNTVSVKTENVSQFSMDTPAELFDLSKSIQIHIDGSLGIIIESPAKRITVSRNPDDKMWGQGVANVNSSFQKCHGVQGTLIDVYASSFMYVYGTNGDPNETELNRIAAVAERDNITGSAMGQIVGDFLVKKDTEITDKDINNYNLILVGRPLSNKITKQIIDKLPLRMSNGSIYAQGKYSSPDLLVRFIYPNPLNPNRYIVVFYAVTPEKLRARKRISKYAPDYMIFRMINTGDSKQREEYLEADLFDGDWQLPGKNKLGF